MSNSDVDRGLSPCPCCQSKVITEPGGYEICEVCNWEDDPVQAAAPGRPGGANRISLEQARLDWAAKWATDIERHYSRNWPARFQRCRWDRGPVHELPHDFRVLVFERAPEARAYATCGMSQSHDESRLELHLLAAPTDEPRPELVELLTVIAHYHRTGGSLDFGHTVSFGRPWLPGSACTHGVLSLPYLDGPDLEWLEHPRIRFLWLIPITEAELLLKKTHGLEALEERFEEAQFDYLDPQRPSVA